MTTYSRREWTPSLILIAVSAAGLLGVVGTSCSSSASGQQTCAGVVNCLCRPDGSCNSGLMCSAGVCVAASGTAGSGAGGSGTGASGPGGSGTGTGGGSGTGASGTGGSGAGTGGAGGTGTGGTGTGGTGGQSTGGPTIISLSTNVTMLDPTETLIVTAIVTHPQGIAQVIGGQLVDPTSGGTYGAFQVSTTAGSYSLSLTWSAIQTVNTVMSAPGTGTTRTLRAQFYDQAAHMTSRDMTITLWCGATNATADGICSGLCVSLDDASNCGSCGHACSAVIPSTAMTSMTPTCSAGKCQFELSTTTLESCNAVCTAANVRCVENDSSATTAQCKNPNLYTIDCVLYSCLSQLLSCSTVPPSAASVGCSVFDGVNCKCSE